MNLTIEETLSDIFVYNGYITHEGESPDDVFKDDAKLDKFCFINVFLDFVKKWDWNNSMSAHDVDFYIEYLEKKYDVTILENKLSDWGTEEHTIWMLFTGMWGDWGTSIRSGWLEPENVDEIIDWLTNQIKLYDERFDYIPIE